MSKRVDGIADHVARVEKHINALKIDSQQITEVLRAIDELRIQFSELERQVLGLSKKPDIVEIEAIHWTLARSNANADYTQEVKWVSTPLQFSRDDFALSSEYELKIRLPRPTKEPAFFWI
jgi:hypothetical protein